MSYATTPPTRTYTYTYTSVFPPGLRVAAAFGGLSKYEQFKALKGGSEVAVATPGRMIDLVKMKACSCARVTYLVFDEADRMFDMGFEPQVRAEGAGAGAGGHFVLRRGGKGPCLRVCMCTRYVRVQHRKAGVYERRGGRGAGLGAGCTRRRKSVRTRAACNPRKLCAHASAFLSPLTASTQLRSAIAMPQTPTEVHKPFSHTPCFPHTVLPTHPCPAAPFPMDGYPPLPPPPPKVRSLLGQVRPDRQTLLFSATMPRKVEALVADALASPVRITVGAMGVANADVIQVGVGRGRGRAG